MLLAKDRSFRATRWSDHFVELSVVLEAVRSKVFLAMQMISLQTGHGFSLCPWVLGSCGVFIL